MLCKGVETGRTSTPSGWGNRARDSRQGGVTKSPAWKKQKGLAFALKDTKKWEAAEIL